MSVTIKDVAREASVSPSTVSRVISNSPRISDETKERVNKVIKELNYHPNVIARSLANNTTNVIGIIMTSEIDDLTKNPFFIQVMTGISSYAKEKGYYIMYTFCTNYEEELKCAKDYVNGNLVDGIILSSVVDNDKCIQYLKDVEFPFVVIGRPENTNNILWVDNDNFKAMYSVVSKLLLKGHKTVAFIGPKTEISVSKDRLSGYIQAHKINGVDINKDFVKEVPGFKEEHGYESMKEILKVGVPEAVVAADDLLAFGAIRCLHENKIKDVSIIGFNNTPQAEYYRPSLTSVDINVRKVGYYASKLLVDRLKDNIKENHYIIGTNLVQRETTNL
ncbi:MULTISPECIES: LacI family DNA-binding transcriptional regulator [Clostridium]|uniref:LacI family DNA-binding transcriptional regulator n=1 Tax=Clostridium TaxID=1485 RepID=UPI00069E646D|nr:MULTISPECIES: LacI family DNA-binding transcriptional regulator [Clostridium]KOF56562.1 LacI family transcriptional regulator [Clostridium sp. DMHC 10]MCD2346411.1 LacI family transcriptional regulator [Clostridium guangxiense]